MQKKFIIIFLLISILVSFVFAVNPAESAEKGHELDEEQSGVFSGDFGESLWTIITFVLLMTVLWKFAWKPLLTSINGRQEYIEKQIKDAESTREQAEEVLAEYNKRLSNADVEGKGIIAAHMKKAEAQRSEMLANTRDELEEMRARLKSEIEQDRRNANEAFWQQAGDIVVNLGSEILGRTIVKEDDRRLISEAIDKLKSEEQSRE